MDNRYDVVIIGSGLGGLECGVILSREGYRVCVLEQSDVYGGCLQSFSRHGKTIDTGVHYIGSMGEGQIMRQYLKYFGIFDKLSFIKLDRDFETMTFAGAGNYSYRQGYDEFLSRLTEQFPREKAGLRRYCEKIKEIGSSIGTEVHKSGRLSAGGTENLGVSAAGFINDCVSDNTLRNILAGTNVLYGGIKEASNLYHHAMVNHSNIEGAYRFADNTRKVARLLVSQIRNHGGTVRNKSRVVRLQAESADIKYAELADSEKISGRYFISDIHPADTFGMLSSESVIKKAYGTRLRLLPNTYGLFSVYLLMKPGQFLYLNRNYYHYSGGDAWDTQLEAPAFSPKLIMLSTQPSNEDLRFSDVVTLMSPVHQAVFDPWRGSSSGNRGAGYYDLKEQITGRIINCAAQYHTELKNATDHICSASPLTYEHYTGTPRGSAYGILKDYRNTISTWIPARTKLNNLYLTGQNLNVHGVLGVTLTAAATCAELLGTEYLAKKIGEAL